MKRFLWLFSCLLLSSGCLITNAHSQADQYAQAESLFKDKRYDEVIRLLSEPASADQPSITSDSCDASAVRADQDRR